MNDKKVLEQLGIKDFRHITREKVVTMASTLDKLDPEIAKKALEQFPEFTKSMREVLVEYKNVIEKGIESNDAGMKAVYDECNIITEALKQLLENENLSFVEKKYVIERMRDMAQLLSEKDSENKKFILNVVGIITTAVAVVLTITGSVIGVNTHLKIGNSN